MRDQEQIKVQTAINETTNEQFSVSKRDNSEVEVKRTRAPKRKEKTSKTIKAYSGAHKLVKYSSICTMQI